MIERLLNERELPAIRSREEMKKTLLDNEYGYLPEVPYEVSVSKPTSVEKRYCCYTGEHSTVEMTVSSPYGSHTFTVNRLLYHDQMAHPLIVFMNFSPNVPDKYYPLEEIADRGFAVLSFCYKDVTSDDGDFTNGLCKVLLPNGQEKEDTAGKIRIWSFAASRLLDYAETLSGLDLSQAAILGHSRLGKTALVTGMCDERFRYVLSNNSGCSGASLHRGNIGVLEKRGPLNLNTGETLRAITTVFPHWFSKKYQSFAEANIPAGFDQHFLLGSIAPRFVFVTSSQMDEWADPDSEFLCCCAASPAYWQLGRVGFCHKNKMPEIDERYMDGRIGYRRRAGMHFLSRHDWAVFLDFIRHHEKDAL